MRHARLLLIGAALAALAGGIAAAPARPSESAAPTQQAAMTTSRYARTIARICDGGVLFTGTHEMGTRAGAIAVSRDIRATGQRRLRRVRAVPKPPRIASQAAHWIATEAKLVDLYALTYLRIWMKIEWAYAHRQRARLPLILHRLVHRPDELKHRAHRAEHALGVPDCTGGG